MTSTIDLINAIDIALDLDSPLRTLLMIDFTFDDLDRCIALSDTARDAELAEIDYYATINANDMPNAFNAPDATTRRIARTLLDALMTLDRDTMTDLRLNHSLCPLHAIDYAICFDDDDADCAQIRIIHPNHDT